MLVGGVAGADRFLLHLVHLVDELKPLVMELRDLDVQLVDLVMELWVFKTKTPQPRFCFFRWSLGRWLVDWHGPCPVPA